MKKTKYRVYVSCCPSLRFEGVEAESAEAAEAKVEELLDGEDLKFVFKLPYTRGEDREIAACTGDVESIEAEEEKDEEDTDTGKRG